MGESEFPTSGIYRVWRCLECGYIFDEGMGDPEEGWPPGTRWANIPDDWICPFCETRKKDFKMIEVYDLDELDLVAND